MLFIGVDFHSRDSTCFVKDSIGNIVTANKIPNIPAAIKYFFQQLGDQSCEVVLEATRGWEFIVNVLDEIPNVQKVHLANPLKAKHICEANYKDDKVDASKLADLLRTNFLPEAYIASKEARHNREVTRMYAYLTKMTTSLKNRVYALLNKQFCYIFTRGKIQQKKVLQILRNSYLPPPDGPNLRNYCEEIMSIQEGNKRIEQQIDLLLHKYKIYFPGKKLLSKKNLQYLKKCSVSSPDDRNLLSCDLKLFEENKKHTTKLIEQICQILERNNMPISPTIDLFSKKGLQFLKSLKMSSPYDKLLSLHIMILDYIEQIKKNITTWLVSLFKDDQRIRLVSSVPGFGKRSAMVIVNEVDDIKRFQASDIKRMVRKFWIYAGLVPRTFRSGDRVCYGSLVTACSKWLKWIFIEAAWVAVRTDSYFRRYFNEKVSKKGRKVAILCVARKLAQIVFHVLYYNRPYEQRQSLGANNSAGENK